MTKTGPVVMVAVVVVIAAGIVVLSGGRFPWSGEAPADDCDIPKSVTGEATSAAPGIQVVDQGSTLDTDGPISVGAVLANTSDKVAYRTRITVKLFDAAHNPIPDTVTVGSPFVINIPIILPGQRIGAGTSTYQGSPKAASASVEIGTTTWLPREAVGKSLTPVTGTYLRTLRFNPRIPTLVDIHYTDASKNCRSLSSDNTAAIFRNTQGKIVGGAVSTADFPIVFRDEQGKDVGSETRRPPSPSCSPGDRETWMAPNPGTPTTADDTRTEIYPYCDLPD
jgi:hypothetical protein